MLTRFLVAAAVLWPAVMAVAVWQRLDAERPAWTTVVYAAASRICHQRPERSFATRGVQWPVCARCAGLYASAPVGAIAAWLARSRRRPIGTPAARRLIILAALPTLTTIAIEWMGLVDPGNLARSAAAIPLGAAMAFVLVQTAAESSKSDRVH